MSSRADHATGGTFITVYPEGSTGQLRALAQELDEVTFGLPGPAIPSDRPLRTGGLVHYRFGAYEGLPMLTDNGTYEAMLVAPGGTLIPDRCQPWFEVPDWAPWDPFEAVAESPDESQPSQNSPILAGRHRVVRAVRHSFRGGVFRAVDEHTAQRVIVKGARAYAGAGLDGRDARDGLRHEAKMLDLLAPTGLAPRCVHLFQQHSDLFLVEDEVAGVTLRDWTAQHVTARPGETAPGARVQRIARHLIRVVQRLHDLGLVVRDLSPENVLVGHGDVLTLLNVETVVPAGTVVTPAYSPGYGAPELLNESQQVAADPRADLYALGATLFHLATGADPALLPDTQPARDTWTRFGEWLQVLGRGNVTIRGLTPAILALVHEDPAQRAGLTVAAAALDRAEAVPLTSVTRAAYPDEGRLLGDGIDHLVTSAAPGSSWWPNAPGDSTDPLNVQHGASGVLGVLARALVHRPDDERLRRVVSEAADWVAGQVDREPRMLPGLHFGRSGTAWALLDAAVALKDWELRRIRTELLLRIPAHGARLGVAHGVAGLGLALVHGWEVTRDRRLLERVTQAADFVAAAAVRDERGVHWPADALPAQARASARLRRRPCWDRHLPARGIPGGGGRAARRARCAGSVAVGGGRCAGWGRGALADDERVWPAPHVLVRRLVGHRDVPGPHVGANRVRALAGLGCARRGRGARSAVARCRWACHGLAGHAELLLDLHDATGDTRYLVWADELVEVLLARHAVRDGRVLLAGDEPFSVTADYGTGLSGAAAMLLRRRYGGSRLWLPATNAVATSRTEQRQHA